MRSGVKWNLVLLTLALSLACASNSFADTYSTLSWSLTGTGVTGSGTLTIDNSTGPINETIQGANYSDGYLVTGMTGTINLPGVGSEAITSLVQYTGTPGTYGVDPSGLFYYDDMVFLASSPEVDMYGLVFDINGTNYILNLCGNPGCNPPFSTGDVGVYVWADNNGTGYIAYPVTAGNFTVPEPSVRALLTIGLVS
jgi:hypothetical protein